MAGRPTGKTLQGTSERLAVLGRGVDRARGGRVSRSQAADGGVSGGPSRRPRRARQPASAHTHAGGRRRVDDDASTGVNVSGGPSARGALPPCRERHAVLVCILRAQGGSVWPPPGGTRGRGRRIGASAATHARRPARPALPCAALPRFASPRLASRRRRPASPLFPPPRPSPPSPACPAHMSVKYVNPPPPPPGLRPRRTALAAGSATG